MFGIQDFSPQRILTVYQEKEPIIVRRSPVSRRYHEMLQVRSRMEQGELIDVIAAEKGISSKTLTRHMSLLSLPEEKQTLLKHDDPSIHDWPIREAIQAGSDRERWLLLVKSLDSAERWAKLLTKGIKQAEIARREGLSRARVCQLIRLNQLDPSVKALIRKGDERYYGISLYQVWQ